MLALKLLARPGGRYVIMPSFTFAATPLAALWAGFEPYFIDVDAEELAADPMLVKNAVAALGDDVAAVMPYSTFGSCIDLLPYEELEDDGVPVIIDAAPTLGSRVERGHFAKGFAGTVVYSLHATKPFGIGEGGLILSNSLERMARLRRGANFGFDAHRQADLVGLNAKLPEVSAAVALATLDGFAARVRRRSELFEGYRNRLRGQTAFAPPVQRGAPVHQFFPVLAPNGVDASDIVTRMSDAGVQARTYFSPACHQQPAFAEFSHSELPVTEDASRRILSLPLWEGLSDDQLDHIVETLLA